MMTTRFSIVAAIAVAAVSALAANAGATTLDQLDHGQSFTVGNATFRNFTYTNNPSTSPNDSSINVATTNVNGKVTITFSLTSGTWGGTQNHSLLDYYVDFAVPVKTVGLDFVANGTGGASFVGETITNTDTSVAFTLPGGLYNDGAAGLADTNSITASLPTSATHIHVQKSIDTALSGTITSVSNSYTAVPEPASLGVLSVAAMGLIARRRRAAR